MAKSIKPSLSVYAGAIASIVSLSLDLACTLELGLMGGPAREERRGENSLTLVRSLYFPSRVSLGLRGLEKGRAWEKVAFF